MDGHRIVIFPDVGGEHRWRLEAENNKIQASGGEGFTRREDAVRAARMTATAFCNLVVVAFGLNLGGEEHKLSEIPVEYEGYNEDGTIAEPQ